LCVWFFYVLRVRINKNKNNNNVKGPNSKRSDPWSTLAQAISTKLEDGNLQAAIRLVCSDDVAATPAEETLTSLRAKRPPFSQLDPSLVGVQCTPLSVNENDVRKTVLSFPAAGSTGVQDGMRPRHLMDLVQCRESGSDFLTALTGFRQYGSHRSLSSHHFTTVL